MLTDTEVLVDQWHQVLGYNGYLPAGERGRRRSKFVLYRRPAANGVRRSKHYVVKTPHSSKAILDASQHSISYTLSRSQAVIVEYTEDPDTDMFQIGRSSESPIDFVVMDTVAGDKTGDTKVLQSTISRFACRIIADRNDVNNCRIYAAGFDSSRNIFLGEKATKWTENHEIDGLTTNGVLIMHPRGDFCGGSATCGPWRETSVGGAVFSLRESRSAQQKGLPCQAETNVLRDGTMIDLCGATLLWRSAEGLKNSPTKRDLEALVDELNAGRPQCPVGLNTLVIPRKLSTAQQDLNQPYVYLNCGHVQGTAHTEAPCSQRVHVTPIIPVRLEETTILLNTLVIPRKLSTAQQDLNQPYVYLNCGHVQGEHSWGADGSEAGTRRCPMCMTAGPVVRVCMGIEPAFYVDAGPPTYAFNPCGHMASERTVKYWAGVDIPHGTNGFHAICPFCAAPLEGSPGYVRLIFQDNLD
ncbi:protein pellino [Ostrinia furnacalis]|uniref:protein pellino n=1 Tax=Ostrinia furnacalis TaxID=93504 RepID=UPI0010408B35|nr:protein pellino [Ostrinia furnacalis]